MFEVVLGSVDMGLHLAYSLNMSSGYFSGLREHGEGLAEDGFLRERRDVMRMALGDDVDGACRLASAEAGMHERAAHEICVVGVPLPAPEVHVLAAERVFRVQLVVRVAEDAKVLVRVA